MLYQVRTQLMSMMSVLDKSLTIICPDRNVKETGELRQRITKAYHESKVGRRKTTGSVTVGLFCFRTEFIRPFSSVKRS